MALAAIEPLVCEEVQLLADCFAPVFTTEIPAAAEELIQRGLLRAFTVREGREFFLAITENGRSYVEPWIQHHEIPSNRVTLGNVRSELATSAGWMKTCSVRISHYLKFTRTYRSQQSW